MVNMTSLICLQDTQLLLWDLEMDEISLPLRYPPTGGSPTFSSGSNSARWDTISPIGTLQPSPSMRDVPKLSPLTVHRSHVDPLSGLIFTEDSVVTICREGHIKIWSRPVNTETISQANSDTVVHNLSATSEENPDRQVNGTSYKQTASIFLRN
ncbi:hypothetical protein MA16_Dca027840 [Dendrobium catenatum]|uniref:Uncharacterized protein n=1 Tax=Dendrobium catenatum TaxID=906689 RepID=A0A2I0VI31_9ASPA|nr:hypothetical protein MA16_Dca027840 [Dendrobium catenatum]